MGLGKQRDWGKAMSDTTTRRNVLGLGAALSAGIAAGAFTRESLAAEPKTKAEGAFVGRYDERLGPEEIRATLVGNTMAGVTYKGQEFLMFVGEDGKVDKLVGDRRETGDWEIADGTIAMQYPTLAGGQKFALELFRFQNHPALFKGYSPTERRWIWFVMEEGRAPELA